MASSDSPKQLALGVDLGGTKIYTLLADAAGRVFSECTVATPAGCGERDVFDAILASLMQVLGQAAEELATSEGRGAEKRPGQGLPAAFPAEIKRCLLQLGSAGYPVIGLGIGVAGVVSACGNIISQAPNLGWKDVSFRRRLETALGLPVRMDNDTNLAAWGEYLYGDHGRPDSLVYVGIGTGIGGGLVINGRLYRGTSGGAGEIGHTVVEPAGPVCSLGHPGCLEA
ncbi:MAG: ROK family protein, partial [Syntrophomonadaceae bacterium]|nr:ROK family protein [Syntrophomonadaceae bacterium]